MYSSPLTATGTSSLSQLYLFGGDQRWSALDWTSSDDTVRGGASYSKLGINSNGVTATFHGNLDITTLGGAGFASQRTTANDDCSRRWDLSAYDGICLDIRESDGKRYTLTVKDTLLPPSSNGREQSSISWEYDFTTANDHGKVKIKWEYLKPTYRGREQNNTAPLDLKRVQRFSLMIRSFFGVQEGDFSLSIGSISAFHDESSFEVFEPYQDEPSSLPAIEEKEKSEPEPESSSRLPRSRRGWLSWLHTCCIV